MSLFEAILLGIIQGLTEFLPISSTAHLVIAIKLLHLDTRFSPEQLTAFEAVIQLGTLAAVLIYFAKDLKTITAAFFIDHLAYFQGKREPGQRALGPSAWLGWYIAIGTVPIVVIGLSFKKQIEGTLTKNLYVIASAMVGLAIILAIAEMVGKRQRSVEHLTWVDAVLIGLAQACALIPGASRSGTTITASLFLGLNRESAARFSFLLSIPAVLAAGLLQFVKEYKYLDRNTLIAVAVSTLVSGISGYAAIAFLIRYLKTHTTSLFIIYRIIVGAGIFLLLALKIIPPI
ncbi:MAG TPA: undecaprenyl-diphosphatase UppP [Acidobacteriota bacterium]|nr:undecaprenyl-diphosphatase UppP [Acidobacteriota bacterium]HND17790.1 undecaprenyl-diphosphatase UppP [Acidobacteriota bacterium]HNH83154.1 undecaprenyl-diphosphatase UppP [Acidobacteriota bacterium]HNJ39565.1 undecaprenyl-diphosphatase UppP [Acidobacteriota bacterium]